MSSDVHSYQIVESRRNRSFSDSSSSPIFSRKSGGSAATNPLSDSDSKPSVRGAHRLSSLTDFCTRMYDSSVPGPYPTNNIHVGTHELGKGAQFQVYGSENMLVPADFYNCIDRPYKTVNSDICGPYRRLVVAIKRPIFDLPTGPLPAAEDEYVTAAEPQPPTGFGTLTQHRNLRLEVFALSHALLRSHRNIVKLIGWGLDTCIRNESAPGLPRPIYPFLIVEHANCSFSDFVRQGRTGKGELVPLQVFQRLTLDVANGLDALHACNITHGDIKPDNVLVFPQENNPPYYCIAKLSDFGLSVSEQRGSAGDVECEFGRGTPGWMAPEWEAGVWPDMLFKTDYFSLGLLIWSIFLKVGKCPLQISNPEAARHALQLATDAFEEASEVLGQERSVRLTRIARLLLHCDPLQRASDLKETCEQLSQDTDSGFDKSGSWLETRFNDDTPWDAFPVNPEAHTLLLESFERFSATKLSPVHHSILQEYQETSARFQTLYAWKGNFDLFPALGVSEYYILTEQYHDTILHLAGDGRYTLDQLIGPEISIHDLFSFGFDDRLDGLEGKRLAIGLSTAIAAVRGYLPAQAICASILNFNPPADTPVSSTILTEVAEYEFEWQRNAVASGYMLSWKFAAQHPLEYQEALRRFREAGGYNQHYHYLPNPTELSCNGYQYNRSGLLHYSRTTHGALPWLKKHPLHRAAALGLVEEIEELLAQQGVYDVNAKDELGETPLLKAAMAGSVDTVLLLVSKGADPEIRSEQSGAFPLHYLFLFPDSSLMEISSALLPKNSNHGTSAILHEKSKPNVPAFHFPFYWPEATPVGWAVLANNAVAVNTLCSLGANLHMIEDFFPTAIVRDWTNYTDRRSAKHLTPLSSHTVKPLDAYRSWIYYSISDFMPPSIMICENWFLGMCRLKGYGKRKRALLDRLEHENPLINSIVAIAGASVSEIESRLNPSRPENWTKYVNKRSRANGRTPLQFAAMRGRIEIVRALLGAGADVNAVPGSMTAQRTALFEAVYANHTTPIIVQILLSAGASIFNSRPLERACGFSDLETVVAILEATKKACIDISPGLPAAANRYDSSESTSLDIITLLINANAQVDYADTQGTALIGALRHGFTRVVQKLLANGANPNWSNQRGDINPLQICIESAFIGHTRASKCVALLLERGASPDTICGSRLATPLQAMALIGSMADVELLLERGARVNVPTPVGRYGSALQAAAARGDVDIVRLLIRRGADINATGGEFGCPLKAALAYKHNDVTELLLEYGATGEAEDDGPSVLRVHINAQRNSVLHSILSLRIFLLMLFLCSISYIIHKWNFPVVLNYVFS